MFYLIYGLNSDFTYFEIFDDYISLKSFIQNFVISLYGNDFKIIKGEIIEYKN